MGKLSSAIVQRKLAPLRDVEEALARQVLYGGDLATNLLEQAPSVDERALTALLAETSGLPAGPAGELPGAEPEARLLVPGDVALRHGLYPLAHDAGTLTVIVAEPLKAEVEQDLAFGLGVSLTQRVAPLVRIREAISREYGVPLDRRSQRVLAKLQGRGDPSPSLEPPPLAEAPDITELPRAPSMPPLGLPAPTDDTSPLYGRQSSPAPPPVTLPAVAPRADEPAPEAPAFPAPAPLPGEEEPPSDGSIHDRLTSPAPAVVPTLEEPTVPWAQGSTGWRDRPSEPPAAGERPSSLPPERGSQPPPSRRGLVQPEALAAWTAESKQAERRRSKARHRGPYTAAEAEADLLKFQTAEARDDVLTAFFDFACQYFEYAALFVVHGDLAEGRAAFGPGADRATVSGIGVPLDLPSSLATVRDERRFLVAPLSRDGLDGRLAMDLERRPGKKVLLLPVSVRGRCVLIFYGDEGAEDVELSEIGNVIAFAPLVASALEAIILRKKAAVRSALGEPPLSVRPPVRRAVLPSREARAEALSEALHAPLRADPEPPVVPEPVPVVQAPPPVVPEPAPVVQAEPAPAAEPEPKAALATPIPRFRPASRTSPTPAEGTRRPTSDSPSAAPEVSFSELDEVGEDEAMLALSAETPDEPGDPAPATVPEPQDGAPGEPPASTVVVAPQLPVRRHQSEELRLPSVILNIESDVDALVQALLQGDESVIPRLTGLGAAAASVLVSKLPGPTTRSVERGTSGPELASQRGPLLKAIARMGPVSVPFLSVRSADPEPRIREWTTLLLGEVGGIDAAQAIVRRVTDDSPTVRRAAFEAGRLLQQHDEDTRLAFRERLLTLAEDLIAPVDARVAALEALAHVRDTRAVPRLIRLAERADETSQSAQWALSIITRQSFGRDAEGWQAWWQQNASRHRLEWLIDSLMHEDTEIRRAAGEELKTLTKEYFGYYDDLSKAERAKAQRRYRDWWESAGKARFAS